MMYVLALLFFFFPFEHTFGASATISLSPSVIQSSQTAALSLSGSDVFGYNMFVPCVDGVSIFAGNSSFPCGMTFSVSGLSTDTVSLSLVNVSGTTKQVLFRVTPKDISGNEISELAQNVYLSVQTVPYPITSFTSNATNNIVATTTTLTWTAINEVYGTNILFSCVDGLTIFSGTNAVPCGTPAFSSIQSKSGSATFSFVYKHNYNAPLSVKVFPGTFSGTYDLTHSQSLDLTVVPQTVAVPKLTSVTVPSMVVSGEPLVLSWNSTDTRGVNIKMLCAEGVTISLSTTTASLPCNAYIAQNAFASSASTTVFVQYDRPYPVDVQFVFFMEIATSTYDGVNTKTARVTVLPKGRTPVVVTTNTIQNIPATNTSGATPLTAVANTSAYVFKKLLKVGSRGADVSALQKMLAQDKNIYPEGLVTGYFGAGTRKAVERLQIKHGITTVGGPGYGQVGPATRAVLNNL